METDVLKHASVTGADHFKIHGYAVIDMPPLSEQVRGSFDNLPRDEHSLKRLREMRLSQYFGYREEEKWFFALLPHRKFIQSAEYVRLAEAGGVMRHREQLECDPSPLICAALDVLPIDKNESYHINVHQLRVTVNAEFRGITVPEGPHRDGHEFNMIAIAGRHNVLGGETQLIDPVSREVVYRQVLSENQAILFDDERYVHYATDIVPDQGAAGHRDIWVIDVNRWHKRAYGPAHERRAREATLSAEAA